MLKNKEQQRKWRFLFSFRLCGRLSPRRRFCRTDSNPTAAKRCSCPCGEIQNTCPTDRPRASASAANFAAMTSSGNDVLETVHLRSGCQEPETAIAQVAALKFSRPADSEHERKLLRQQGHRERDSSKQTRRSMVPASARTNDYEDTEPNPKDG